jgi:hypothetical protein
MEFLLLAAIFTTSTAFLFGLFAQQAGGVTFGNTMSDERISSEAHD